MYLCIKEQTYVMNSVYILYTYSHAQHLYARAIPGTKAAGRNMDIAKCLDRSYTLSNVKRHIYTRYYLYRGFRLAYVGLHISVSP
jgi:hypothetical protein